MRWKARARRDKTKWHDWFAWHPVKINGFRHWLETVHRRAEVVEVFDGLGPAEVLVYHYAAKP